MESESEASVQEIYTAMHIKTSRFRVLVTFLQFSAGQSLTRHYVLRLRHIQTICSSSAFLWATSGVWCSMVEYGGGRERMTLNRTEIARNTKDCEKTGDNVTWLSPGGFYWIL